MELPDFEGNMEAQLRSAANQIRIIQDSHSLLSLKFETIRDQIKLLKDNISTLKSIKVIVVASEYKRSKESLKCAEAELNLITIKMNEATDQLTQLRSIFHRMFEAYKVFRQERGTVLVGNFGGQRNG